MKKIHVGSHLMSKVYDSIPDKEKDAILKSKEGVMTASGNRIRIQAYIPKEVYVMLEYFGAFTGSQSDFFTMRSCEFIEQRAIQTGLMNVLSHSGGR